MRHIEIWGNEITDPGALIDSVADGLWPGETIGRNLDALYDRLTETNENIRIIVMNADEMLLQNPDYRRRFLKMLKDAAEENPERLRIAIDEAAANNRECAKEDRERPGAFAYHFEPKLGWMNDPNGLIFYRGKYHLFFQHNPYETKWGPMHWGHAVSEDLVNFTQLPIALYPDMPYEDEGGCYSGSAVEKDGKLYLFYTSVSRRLGQTQSVAISGDGVHFEKYEGNPVIGGNPTDGCPEFRDPKVFAYEGEYRMVVGTRTRENGQEPGFGRILQYRSADLLDWEYVGVLYEDKTYTDVIECPDLFRVGDDWVLMFSKIGGKGSGVEMIRGTFDGTSFCGSRRFAPEAGPQFYAPQTMTGNRGQRLLVGWFYDWKKKCPAGEKKAGAFTVPRQVSLREGTVFCSPAKEVQHLLRTLHPTPSWVKLWLLDQLAELWVSDHGLCVRSIRTKERAAFEGRIERLQILEDQKAVELFINEGEKNITLWCV